MTGPEGAVAYARRHRSRFVEELKRFVSFPSVSSQAKHKEDVKSCAVWLAGQLRRIGLARVCVIATSGHPIVYAQWVHWPERPTVLIYGHYDVVAADPPGEWKTPPFAPAVRNGHLYGRGASDDKGQMWAHVKAVESYLQSGSRLPVNVKFLFDGEEEVQSPHLADFVKREREGLAADAAVISDTRMLGPGRPAISYSERGALRLELEMKGAAGDVHSGNFGGAIQNPLQALCELIGGLHDEQGRVTIPGFYDQVRRVSEAERAYLGRTGPSDRQILRDAGARRGWGEEGYSLYERTTIRPSLTVTSLSGGHQGAGTRAVIPTRAAAKFDLRLVPEQNPKEIARLFREHVAQVSPAGLTATVREVGAGVKPAVLKRNHASMRAAATGYQKGFGKAPVFVRSGGTMPVLSTFREVLGMPTVLMGFALPDDGAHGVNEKFRLQNFCDGIVTTIWFLAEMSRNRDAPVRSGQRERSLAYGD